MNEKADKFRREQLYKKTISQIIINMLKTRKTKNATVYYNYKILAKALKSMTIYADQQRAAGSLNRKVVAFLRNKAMKVYSDNFYAWFDKAQHIRQERLVN